MEADQKILSALEIELSTGKGIPGQNSGHWMLGYPSFTLEDPRDFDEDYAKYDTLLLQMDSDGPRYDYILWGDLGTGYFFINHESLEKGDFSDILYSWDCS